MASWPFVCIICVAILASMTMPLIRAKLACEDSGYCSLDYVKPWSGDILTGDGLKAALAARSFRQEIIVSATDRQSLDMSARLDFEVRALGFGHMLFVTSYPECCAVTTKALPHIGCAWDSTEVHPAGFDFEPLLWNWRWKFSMRAARLGYNVMTVDLDVLFFNDPYVHLKQPPFSNVTLLANPEVHYFTPVAGCGMNGGFAYIQNAAPNGPVTWMFKEVVERPLRLLDDDMATLKNWSTAGSVHREKTPRICMTFDQSWLDDALHSTLVGVPVFFWLYRLCADAAFRDRPAVQRLDARHWSACDGMADADHAGVDGRQLPHMQSRNGWRYGTMRVPSVTEEEWHTSHLNRSLYPPARGKWSQRLWQQLADDCHACPSWRDQRDGGGMGSNGSTSAPDGRDINETFSFVPQWLFSNFWTSGTDGFWSPDPVTGEAPLQVMGHIHLLKGTPRSKGSKLGIGLMHHPPDNYTAFAQLHSAGTPYLTHQPVIDRVLTFLPSLDLAHAVHNLPDLHRAMGGLVQLATLSNRTIAWPFLSCNATWMLQKSKGHRHHSRGGEAVVGDGIPPPPPPRPLLPLNLKHVFMPLDDDAYRPAHACFLMSLLGSECSHRNALLPTEFRHWRDTYRGRHVSDDVAAVDAAAAAVAPTTANTVLLPSPELAALLANSSFVFSSTVGAVSLEDARSALARADAEPVVYVGYPFVVDGYDELAFRQRAMGCQAFHTDWADYSALYTHELITFATPAMHRVSVAADGRALSLAPRNESAGLPHVNGSITFGLEGNKCLDVPHNALEDGVEIVLWGCNGGLNQLWSVAHDGRIRNILTHLYLDAGSGGPEGGFVKQRAFAESASQIWSWDRSGTLRPAANPSKCLDVVTPAGGKIDVDHPIEDNTKLVLHPCRRHQHHQEGGDRQRWSLETKQR